MLTALRRLIAFLILTVYMSAAIIQHVPLAHAMSVDMSTGMAHGQEGPPDRMPCNSTPAPCVTDLGCMFLVSVLTPDLTLFTRTAWLSVIYGNTSDALRGRTIEPALGPPITLA